MLTATQTKYARERTEAIYRRKTEKLSEDFNGSQKISTEAKVEYLRNGDFAVLPGDHYRWYDAIQFPRETPKMTQAQYNAEVLALKKRRDDIIDQLVLGEASDALNAIKAFEEDTDVQQPVG